MSVAALRRPTTYLRVVFLLLGAALALSFGLLDITLIALLLEGPLPVALELAVSALLIVVPPVLLGLMPAARQVEAVAAESLLGVRFPDGTPGPARRWDQRRRSAGWFLLHVLAGGVVGFMGSLAIPLAPALIAAPFSGSPGHRVLSIDWLRTTGEWTDLWMPVAGVLGVVATGVVAAGLGAVLARIALHLLGPSYAERLQRLEVETARLAGRNRIAREIHDSVGHALSLVTLQAGAARKLLDRDPEFAAEALKTIESTSRAATADLDHLLGVLRDGDAAVREPAPDLGALPTLVAAIRSAGLDVTVEVDGEVGDLPGVVSREAYRIVQEGLTNALRYATARTARLRISRDAGTLRLTLSNPAAGGRVSSRGQGLRGIAERVGALGGTVDGGMAGRDWRLVVELPLGDAL